jgi:tetratricopeptide (TPR) repeat protein
MPRHRVSPLERFAGDLGAAEILRFAGDVSDAAELKRELVAVGRAHPNVVLRDIAIERSTAATLSDLSYLELDAGRLGEARAHAEEALEIRRELGDAHGISHALLALATVAYHERDFSRARELFGESARFADEAHLPGDLAEARIGEAECELHLNRLDEAAHALREALAALEGLGDRALELQALRVAAMLAAVRGRSEQSALLFGAKDALSRDAGLALFGGLEIQLEDALLEQARRDAEAPSFDAALARGRELSWGDALALAVQPSRGRQREVAGDE